MGSLGAPLITSVATTFHVSLGAAQWTLTLALLTGAIATPLFGRLGAGSHRRPAILGVLAVIVAGSSLTVLPLPFAFLLVGRGAQGLGFSLTPLMMGVARDHLPEPKGSSTIALLSVISIVGVGVGYPLSGALSELGGVRAAYGLGVAVSVMAFGLAWRFVPAAPAGRTGAVDVPGALILTAGLLPLLLVLSESGVWTSHSVLAIVLTVLALLILSVWAIYERRVSAPLIDVRLLRHRAVAGANLAMLLGGAGMYLLITLITRYSQTSKLAGYGFGLNTFEAGLVLVPFSVMGFVAGRLTPRLRARIGAEWLLAVGAMLVLGGFALFGFERNHLVVVLIAMALLGFGIGTFSSAMPAIILAVTSTSETSSAMSFNIVVRSVGFSLGSALGGLVLGAYTQHGQVFPEYRGYSAACWIGAIAMVAAAVCSVAVGSERASREQIHH